MRILLAEDETKLANALRHRLERDGHRVDLVHDGESAIHSGSHEQYEVILLDLMLPGRDGFTVCRTLRERDRWMPILIITARDDVRDRVRGLDVGADDYLVKPFAFAELVARLRAIMRRAPVARPTTVTVADLVLDPAARTVTRAGRPVPLSATEYNLLELLVRHRGAVVDRSLISRTVWGTEETQRSNVADVYIGYLRRKLASVGCAPVIHTVRGVGYRIDHG